MAKSNKTAWSERTGPYPGSTDVRVSALTSAVPPSIRRGRKSTWKVVLTAKPPHEIDDRSNCASRYFEDPELVCDTESTDAMDVAKQIALNFQQRMSPGGAANLAWPTGEAPEPSDLDPMEERLEDLDMGYESGVITRLRLGMNKDRITNAVVDYEVSFDVTPRSSFRDSLRY